MANYDQTVWKIICYDNDDYLQSHGTGVSIGPNLILSCYHLIEPNTKTIIGRKINSNASFNILTREHTRVEFDLLLLSVELPQPLIFPFLSENENLEFGGELISVGNENDLIGVVTPVKVGWSCTEVAPSAFLDRSAVYNFSDFPSIRPYMVLGDFIPNDVRNVEFEDVDMNMPIIFYSPVVPPAPESHTQGRSGGPLFRHDGTVVGISIAGFAGRIQEHAAVHVSVLRFFLNEAATLREEKAAREAEREVAREVAAWVKMVRAREVTREVAAWVKMVREAEREIEIEAAAAAAAREEIAIEAAARTHLKRSLLLATAGAGAGKRLKRQHFL